MSFPATLSHTGALTGSPSVTSVTSPSLQEILSTTFSATLSGRKSGSVTVSGATDGVPFVLNFESITKARLFGLRVPSGQSIKVKVTSSVGTDQSFMCSNLLLWYAPNSGDEITAIKFVGTADLEYVLAGDIV